MSDDKLERQEEMFPGASQHDGPAEEPVQSADDAHLSPADNTEMSDDNTLSAANQSQDTPTHGYDLAGYALGALDEADMTRIRTALASDTALQAELREMESVLTEFALLVPRQQINRGRSAGIRSRLIARAASTRDGRMSPMRPGANTQRPKIPIAEPGSPNIRRSTQGTAGANRPGGTSSTSTASERPQGSSVQGSSVHRSTPSAEARSEIRTPSYSDTRRVTGTYPTHSGTMQPGTMMAPPRPSGAIRGGVWVALAVVLAAIVGGIQEWRLRAEQNDLRRSVAARDAELTSQVATLQTSIAEKDSMIQVLTGPNMKVVDLVSSAAHDPTARMFWDKLSHKWTMRAYNLRPPRPGKTYQVWLITQTSPTPISAGTFEPDARGNATFQATYELPKNALIQVAISEEPAGGVPEPTGPIVISGK